MKVKISLKARELFKNKLMTRQFLRELMRVQKEGLANLEGNNIKQNSGLSYEIRLGNTVYKVKQL